jgi:lysophospholipase L1-like esterase
MLGKIIMLAAAAALVAAAPASPREHWVASWGSAQQVPEAGNALPDEGWRDTTIRQVVHLSAGGPGIRVRFSNVFGTAPMTILGAHVARAPAPGSARIDPRSDWTVTFAGRREAVIPAGADYLSDPIALVMPPHSDLAISIRIDGPPARQTGHPGSRATSWVAAGDALAAADLPGARAVEHWYSIAEVDILASPAGGTIVAFGDSITDGHGSTLNGNDRWPDDLAARLEAARAWGIGVVNAGIGGNRLLLDGLGPNALARFDRDVVDRPGVRWVIVLEGVNDLGTLTRDAPATAETHRDLVERIEAAYAQMIERAHAHGITAIGATILPYGGSAYYHPGAPGEADRQAVNRWIRGHFDAVVDFDAATRDPAHPDRLRADLDSGDGLHPSPAGYRAMAAAIPLSLFRR